MRTLFLLVVLCIAACGQAPGLDGGTGGGSPMEDAGRDGGGDGGTDAGADAGPSWFRDVLPVAQRSCLGCHRDGGVAPFSLETWSQAAPRAPALAAAVETRHMPVWLPDPTCGPAPLGERLLTAEEIATVVAWAATGAREGRPDEAPTPGDAGTSALPRVDATFALAAAHTPSADAGDQRRCFLLEPALAEPRQVTGFQLVPGTPTQVLGAVLHRVDRAEALARDAMEAAPGWPCPAGPGLSTSGVLGAVARGTGAVLYPEGGVRLGPAQGLVAQLLYRPPGGVPLADQSAVQVMLATQEVPDAVLVPLQALGFTIPAGATGFSYSQRFPLASPLRLWGLVPQLQALGQRLTVRGAGNDCLLDLRRWDPSWQQGYLWAQPRVLQAGEAFNLTCEWDNPGTQTVRSGEGAGDERCLAWVYATSGADAGM